MLDTIQNIITFGGHKKVMNAAKEFRKVNSELKLLNEEYKSKLKLVNTNLDSLTELKIKAVKKVSKIKKITSLITIKDREVIESNLKGKEYTLANIENNLSISEDLINLGKSSFRGVAISGLSVGASWTLAGSIGTASTGVAISSLSGAAATNATLAWLGGGSIATGGLGMSGGALMLGGIFFIPALVIIGLIQHNASSHKVKEINKKKIETIKKIDTINENLILFKGVLTRCDEYMISLNKSIDVFSITYKQTYKKIYKYGVLSKLYKKMMHMFFDKKKFSQNDLNEISHLGKCTSDIMKIIDTKIL